MPVSSQDHRRARLSGRAAHQYPDDPDHLRWLTDELLPHPEGGFPLLTAPAGRCLMGTSFGAVAHCRRRSGSLAHAGRCCCRPDHFLYPIPMWGLAKGPCSTPSCASMITTVPTLYARTSCLLGHQASRGAAQPGTSYFDPRRVEFTVHRGLAVQLEQLANTRSKLFPGRSAPPPVVCSSSISCQARATAALRRVRLDQLRHAAVHLEELRLGASTPRSSSSRTRVSTCSSSSSESRSRPRGAPGPASSNCP